MSLEKGARVTVRGESGTVRFIGPTSFSTGQWIGVELDTPSGKNDGSVQGTRYFECANQGQYGLFVRPSLVKPIENTATRPPSSMVMGPPPSLKPQTDSGGRGSPEIVMPKRQDAVARKPSTPMLKQELQSQTQSHGNTGESKLTRQLENLKSKLRVMERKRFEDKERSSQDSKRIAKLENMVKRLQVKLTPMHEEVKSLRQRLADAESNVNTTSNDDALEMATLDREMAEEKAETLQQELESLRQKFQDLELECEILREENGLFSSGDKGSGDQGTILRLEKRNANLESALVKLREVYNSQETTYKSRVSELEQEVQESGAMSSTFQQTSDRLQEAEAVILDLRQQLDDALGAEDMIENLSDKNLELSEKITELETTIEELETLKELNDEIEASNELREKELSQELESLQQLNNRSKAKITEFEERNVYLENAIVKYRELVSTLDSELQTLRESESSAARDQAQEIAQLDLNFATSSMGKALELEVKKFESQQVVSHLNIVKCYLPDDYSTDEQAIDAFLRLDRIAHHAQLAQNYMKEQPLDDNAAVVAKICVALLELRSLCNGFVEMIRRSSVEDFAKFAVLSEQVKPVDDALTQTLDLIQKNELREVDFLKSINSSWIKMRRLSDDYELCKRSIVEEILDFCDLGGVMTKKLGLDLPVMSRAKVVAKNLAAELKSWPSYYFASSDMELLGQIRQMARNLVNCFISMLEGSSAQHIEGSPEEYAEGLTQIKQVSTKNLVELDMPSPPWTLRAEKINEMKQQEHSKDSQIEQLKQQEAKLVTALRTREKSMEELQVKIGLLNSKLTKSKDQDKLIQDLKRNLTEAVENEKRAQEDIARLKEEYTKQDKKRRETRHHVVPDASVVTLHSKIQALQLQLSFESQKKVDLGWMKPLETRNGRVRSRLLVSCNRVFKDLRDAVDKYDTVAVSRTAHKRRLIHHLAQVEGLQNIRVHIMHLLA